MEEEKQCYNLDFSVPKIVIRGERGIGPGNFSCPSSVVLNSEGKILVCDSCKSRILMYEQDGRFYKSFGCKGTGPGQFRCPAGIAVDDKDNIYVTDSWNNNVQIFNSDGSKVIKIIGRDECKSGNGDGAFYWPTGVFVNPRNQDILVADTLNHRIQIFDKHYNFSRKFGSYGKENGRLNQPAGIAVNSQNEILVSECDNDRIQIFDYTGVHSKCIDSQCFLLRNPHHICVDQFDNIYVGSRAPVFPVRIFDKHGNLLKSLKLENNGVPFGVNLDPANGSLLITDGKNDAVYIYAANDVPRMCQADGKCGKLISRSLEYKRLKKRRINSNTPKSAHGLFKRIYGTRSNTKKAFKMRCDSSEPKKVIGEFTSRGDSDGLFDCPSAITSNSQGQILVCDNHNNRVQMFEQDGTFIKSFGTISKKECISNNPNGIAVDCQDNILVTDYFNYRNIQIFNGDGSKVINIIGREDNESGRENGEFEAARGIFVNPQNQDILVVDYSNHRIQIFDKNLRFKTKFGSRGSGKGELRYPVGIVVNSKNQILVSELGNHRIQVFDYQGNHLRFIGHENGELNQPYYLCIDEGDNIYVGSYEDGFPVQIFDKEDILVKSLRLKADGRPMGVNIHSIDGSLMVTDWKNHVVYIY